MALRMRMARIFLLICCLQNFAKPKETERERERDRWALDSEPTFCYHTGTLQNAPGSPQSPHSLHRLVAVATRHYITWKCKIRRKKREIGKWQGNRGEFRGKMRKGSSRNNKLTITWINHSNNWCLVSGIYRKISPEKMKIRGLKLKTFKRTTFELINMQWNLLANSDNQQTIWKFYEDYGDYLRRVK